MTTKPRVALAPAVAVRGVLVDVEPVEQQPFYCSVHGTVTHCPWSWMDCTLAGDPTPPRCPPGFHRPGQEDITIDL